MAYGLVERDVAVVITNGVTCTLLGALAALKVRLAPSLVEVELSSSA